MSITAPTLRRALNSRPRDGGRDAKLMSTRPPDQAYPVPWQVSLHAGQDPIVLRTPVTATYLQQAPPLRADGLITDFF